MIINVDCIKEKDPVTHKSATKHSNNAYKLSKYHFLQLLHQTCVHVFYWVFNNSDHSCKQIIISFRFLFDINDKIFEQKSRSFYFHNYLWCKKMIILSWPKGDFTFKSLYKMSLLIHFIIFYHLIISFLGQLFHFKSISEFKEQQDTTRNL